MTFEEQWEAFLRASSRERTTLDKSLCRTFFALGRASAFEEAIRRIQATGKQPSPRLG